MRSLGEFFGHIVKGIRTDPTSGRRVVKKETEEEREGNMILRRTTIEEIEIGEQTPDRDPKGNVNESEE